MTKTWPCHKSSVVPLAKALRDEGLEARQLSKIQSALIALGCNETL